jgi:hypothetical protein
MGLPDLHAVVQNTVAGSRATGVQETEKMVTRSFAALIVGAATMFSAAGALAQGEPLPDAIYHAQTSGGSYDVDLRSPVLTAPGTVGVDMTWVTMGATPSPFALSDAQVTGDEIQSFAFSEIQYSFRVSGPADILIPMTAHVVANAYELNPGVGVGGEYNVSVNSPQAAGFQVYSNGQSGFQSFSGDVQFTVMANQINGVDVYANAAILNFDPGVGTHVRVYADPVFTIDSAFALANPGYTLAFSNGIGNALPTGVPEPATWAMLLIGLAGTGAVLRRRVAAVNLA